MNEPLHAISLLQPWASLIAIEAKQWETRSWRTHRRGRVAIHASVGNDKDIFAVLSWNFEIRAALADAGITRCSSMQRGAIIAVADIVDCQPSERLVSVLSEKELAFGNYAPKRFAFKLANVVKLLAPVPCKGALSFWKVPTDIAGSVLRQAEVAA